MSYEIVTVPEAPIEEAYDGIEQGHGGPFGSVIVRDGEIIGSGHNRVCSIMIPLATGKLMRSGPLALNWGLWHHSPLV